MDKISLKTDAELPKNYDFKTAEARWIKNWAENKYFEFNRQNSGELFVVDTPPPYVSADHLHAGHIMSYAQAEFIVRYKRMRGFNVFTRWDLMTMACQRKDL